MSRPALGRVSVAILSWNGLGHLKTCLEALGAQDDPGVPWEVLVLDNGSRDGTATWLRSRHGKPPVRLVESPVNLGFCAGNGRLVEEARGDAVAFLNNDTRPEPGWLKALVEALAASPPDVAAVSGKIVDWEAERLDFARGVMTFDGHAFQLDFRRPLTAARVPAAGSELAFACGGNMLVRRASFLAAGGFDTDYFAYLEDVDLGWRLWAGGERVLFAPEAVVRHRSSATSDLLGLYNRGFLFERNAFLTAYKNYEDGLWERMMPAVLLTLLARQQALLLDNPGGDTLRIDPYAGWIANTPRGAGVDAAARAADGADGAPRGWGDGRGGGGAAPAAHPRPEGRLREDGGEAASGAGPGPGAWMWPRRLARRYLELGPREFARRGWEKLAAAARARGQARPAHPTLTDERTVAQLRAINYLLGHLDAAAGKRRVVQARRRRSDGEYFERFPLYVVPTYPGDAHLFASPGFRSWLPPDVPLVEARLDEVMEWET